MAQTKAAMLLGVALLIISASFADAVTWKLNSTVQSTWNAWYGYPPSQDPPCTGVGVCVPANTTIPSGTLWYWCGWTTKQRTEYWVNSAGANVTVAMMRQSDLYNCALANVTNIKSCYILTDSTCDTSTKCYNKIYGMSFVDPSCVIVANNDKGSAQVSIQVWQYYDSRRYYGTVFSILMFILVMFAAAGNIGYTCYHQIKKPNHRLDELEQKMRQGTISSAQAVDAADGTGVFRDASEGAPGPVPAARRALLSQSVASTDRPVDEELSVGGTRARNSNNNASGTSTGPTGVGGLIDRMKQRVSGPADGGDKGAYQH